MSKSVSKNTKTGSSARKGEVSQNKLEYWLDKPQRIVVAGAVLGVGTYFTYKLVKDIIAKIRANKAGKLADDDPNVRAAMTIRTAMNPSGISWMRSIDQTNEEAIFNAAGTITNLDKVLKAYKQLYASDMLADLQSELDADEYQKFMNIITSNPNKSGGAVTELWAKKGQMVVAKQEVTLRKTPDASYHGAFYESKSLDNIISKSNPGALIGYATGVQQFDTKNNVKFIQVGYVIRKDQLPASYKKFAGQKKLFWVSSSGDYVALFSDYKSMYDRYPNTKTISAYMKPYDFYETSQRAGSSVSGAAFFTVVSTQATQVLNEKLLPVAGVQHGTILGIYLGELNTGNKKYVKFLTASHTQRWADKQTIKIYRP